MSERFLLHREVSSKFDAWDETGVKKKHCAKHCDDSDCSVPGAKNLISSVESFQGVVL